MEQPALQKLLYDLEVGMPFLFVDQLDVQVPPQTTAGNEGGAGSGSCWVFPANGKEANKKRRHGLQETAFERQDAHFCSGLVA